MMNKSTAKIKDNMSPGSDVVADLLGKKSVRATFRLRPEVIDLMGILAAQLGIKQKSLFDYLMEDQDALRGIARDVTAVSPDDSTRSPKTFVVSHRSLSALEAVAEEFAVLRDDLIEHSIKRLLPVYEKERLRQGKREDALGRIASHFNETKRFEQQIRQLLGEEDAIYQALEDVISFYEKTYADIEQQVEKGKRITAFPADRLETGMADMATENNRSYCRS